MGAWKIFIKSIKILFHHKRLWLFLFLVEFILALVLINPVSYQFNHMFSHSLAANEILQGKGANSIIEFLVHKAETITLQKQILLIAGFFYLGLTIFFNAGIISCLLGKKDFEGTFFFHSAARFVGPFFRLFLWSLPFYFIALILHSLLGKIFTLISGNSEPLIFILFIVNLFILAVLFLFIKMVFDYTKIALISENKRKVIPTNLSTWKFVAQNLSKALRLFYLIVFLGIILYALYLLLCSPLNIHSWITILLLLACQQLFAFSRKGIKIIYFASLIYLFQNIEEPLLRAWYKDDSFVDKMMT